MNDPFLSETKEKIYYYLEELQDCRDIHITELEYLWLNRLKVILCVVQGREVFQKVDEMYSVKKPKGDPATKGTPSQQQTQSASFAEEELEDIYEDDEEEDEEEYEETDEEEWTDEEEYEETDEDDVEI
jgi:hypothetical protein